MQTKTFLLLAEAGGDSLTFSGFQKGFFDAWDFVFPNALMLLLCIIIGHYVGKLELPWLRIPWDKTRDWLRTVNKFLEDSNLFGAKFFPAVVLIAVVIAGLDIFQVMRITVSNLLPPEITYTPAGLYEQYASDELLLRLVVEDKSISEPYEIYRRIEQWGQKMDREHTPESSSNYDHWSDTAGRWSQRADNFKLLGGIACLSCFFGLLKRHWMSILRLIAVFFLLTGGYFYCVAKELYAQEQKAYAVLTSLEEHTGQAIGGDWNQELAKRVAELSRHGNWLTEERPASSSGWWRFQFFDNYFFKRTVALFRVEHPEQNHRPLVSKQFLEDQTTGRGRNDISSQTGTNGFAPETNQNK